MNFNIQTRFSNELPADIEERNFVRPVEHSCFSFVSPVIPKNPKLIHVSDGLAQLIGIKKKETLSDDFLQVFSGKKIQPETRPFAMNYAGHQFGNWAGQLGDGRAINLFEIDHNKQHLTLQLKGAGKTPYSRSGDGLAVLRSSVREHLCSEAMHYLGIPTTRSLSLISTGDEVLRDVMYDGNPDYEKGAVICRVAPTFIRFGNFELFSAQNDIENLKALVDFTIKYFYTEIQSEGKEKYIHFFKLVAEKTRKMIIHWQRIGFVHGVMNTDNMSIHGITIDYGPYGWLEDYNPNWTPNTTDREHRRYCFGNQPDVAQWNLFQLANALYPLIEETSELEKIVNDFKAFYDIDYVEMMKSKLGLEKFHKNDEKFISELEKMLQITETDMTIFFRLLSSISKNDCVEKALSKIHIAFYFPSEIIGTVQLEWKKWFQMYLERINLETTLDKVRKEKMDKVNPKYVLRNYMAQLAIDAANNSDYSLIEALYQLLKKPYNEQPENEKWFAKRPDWAREKVGCSMLSCSS